MAYQPPALEYTFEDWATEQLKYESLPVYPDGVLSLATVYAGEGSQAQWNPGDTILYLPGATAFNSFGPGGRYHVWNYPTPEIGFEAYGETLAGWPVVMEALRARSSAELVCRALDESDGVGGAYYQSVLPYVRANWATESQRLVAGSGSTPPPPPPPPQPIGTEEDMITLLEVKDAPLGPNGWWTLSGGVAVHVPDPATLAVLQAGARSGTVAQLAGQVSSAWLIKYVPALTTSG